jgi:hypothetical protein
MTKPTPLALVFLLFAGALLLFQALTLRDKNQAILHQRDVTPTLNHCKTR